MSHIVTVKTELRDEPAVRAACRRLRLPDPVRGEARLYGGRASGLLVRLPGWQYPAVIDTATGEVRYDTFEGRWGDARHLQALTQAYAVERVLSEARARGHVAQEEALADGSIRLRIQGV